MEDNAFPTSSIIPETRLNTHMIEEGPRICPLCSSEIRLFFIHFNEKMLMCENVECEYPFGYEELQFVQIENDEDLSDVISARSKNTAFSPPASVVSTSGWSEIENINRVYDSEDSQLEPKMLNIPAKKATKKGRKITSLVTNRESVKQMQKNVKDLKGLSLELMEITTPKNMLRNEKWIKNLRNLQDQSGLQLLKPQEMKTLNKNVTKNELKIDIEPGDSNCVSSIKIEIANANNIPNKC